MSREQALKGKAALVTGSTQGIGQAFATALAREGCNVVLNGMGDAKEIERLRGSLAERYGVKVLYSPADVSRPADIESMMKMTADAFGAVDVLINNAVTRHIAAVHEIAVEKWDYALAVNLSSAFHTSRLALPAMRERKWGRIINLASMLSSRALPNKVDYVVTKHAIVGLTRTIAVENANTGVTCNCIAPGWVLTPHSERTIAEEIAETGQSRDDAILKLSEKRGPSRRIINAQSIAAMAVFLCSDDAKDVTGAVMPVDGGWSAAN